MSTPTDRLVPEAREAVDRLVYSPAEAARALGAVSYTHLTLPTNREV